MTKCTFLVHEAALVPVHHAGAGPGPPPRRHSSGSRSSWMVTHNSVLLFTPQLFALDSDSGWYWQISAVYQQFVRWFTGGKYLMGCGFHLMETFQFAGYKKIF